MTRQKQPRTHSKRPAPLKVVAAETPAELKDQFATNLDMLLSLVGLSRKEASEKIGVPYKLIRRLVSAGVSRVDEGNRDNLKKFARFFALPQVEDFWLDNLIPWLLQADEGKRFVRKFRKELRQFRDQQVSEIEAIDQDRLQLLEQALGIESESKEEDARTGAYLERAKVVLQSDRAEQFEKLIDDYFEMVSNRRHATG